MQEKTKDLLREELYERVWTTPMRKLAQEFKYSDVGLAKLCHRHHIPTPGLGYWRKVELGHKPPRVPLPAISRNGPYSIRLVLRSVPVEKEIAAAREIPVIAVALNVPLSHVQAIRSERLLRNARADEKGLLVPRKGCATHLLVTGAQLPRALSILDALFRAVEERSIRVTWSKEEGARLTINCASVKLELCLSEILNSRPHVVTPEEEARRKRDWAWSPPKRDYEATGSLRIVLLGDETTSVRHTWSEGRKKKKLEESLGDVVAGIEPLARAIEAVKEERERWHRQLAAEQKRREEARRQHEEFVRRGGVITKAAEALRQSQLVRRFVITVGSTPKLHQLDTESLRRVHELLAFCSEYADSIDPTCHLDELLKNFEKPRSWYDP
jgi:hypothetical protein